MNDRITCGRLVSALERKGVRAKHTAFVKAVGDNFLAIVDWTLL